MSSFEANKTKAVVDSMNSVFNPMAKVKIETVFPQNQVTLSQQRSFKTMLRECSQPPLVQ